MADLCLQGAEKLYYPSEFQVHEYCKRKSHKKCPFYALGTNSEEIDRMVSTAHC